MKVRIGLAAGAGAADQPQEFIRLVDALDDLGYDSIWVPDVVTTSTLDPLAALGVAAGRRSRLKIGSHLIVPGRNPVLLAKQLATLDQLSEGRLLLNMVLGLRQPAELAAQGVEAGDRTRLLEEGIATMRALWAGEEVGGAHLDLRPYQQPLSLWLGGVAPAALRRCGRIGEGWMPGLCTPAEAAANRAIIDEAAVAAGRSMDPEHFGVNLLWCDRIDDAVRDVVAARRKEGTAEDVVAVGAEGLAEQIHGFLAVGFSKFVLRPALNPTSWPEAVESVADVLSLQT